MQLSTNKKLIKSKLDEFVNEYKQNLNKQRQYIEANHLIEHEAKIKLGISPLTLRNLTLQHLALK